MAISRMSIFGLCSFVLLQNTIAIRQEVTNLPHQMFSRHSNTLTYILEFSGCVQRGFALLRSKFLHRHQNVGQLCESYLISGKTIAITSPCYRHISTFHLTTKQMDSKTAKEMQTQLCINIFIQCYMCLLSIRDIPALNCCPILWHVVTGSLCLGGLRVLTCPPIIMPVIHKPDPGPILWQMVLLHSRTWPIMWMNQG